jgi:glyoxylase-like metal-dependent hydrolase (beta-lactamase superfamily II)
VALGRGLNPPGVDELEISVFGRGYGESVVCHLGGGDWLVVDSFIDRNVSLPVASRYLQELDGDHNVDAIVVTHWDDDHTQGTMALIDRYNPRQVWLPLILREQEIVSFALAHHDALQKVDLESGVSEFAGVMRRTVGTGKRKWAVRHVQLPLDGPTEVHVLTPDHDLVGQGLAHLGSLLGVTGEPGFGRIRAVGPNPSSVVLWLESYGRRVLLGADLENGQLGWPTVEVPASAGGAGAQVFKVAHHGSPNADHVRIWEDLLIEVPHAAVTRFTASSTPRPAESDRGRIASRTDKAWVVGAPGPSVRATDPDFDAVVAASTVDGFFDATGEIGHVRYRCKRGGRWRVDYWGHVEPL